jgi:putative endonuclease
MKEEKTYAVYIATNYPRKTVLYIGVTNNVFNREHQHRIKFNKNSFTAKYNINRIVYYEAYGYINTAIAREKELKGWTRKRKIDLIVKDNPDWLDMIEESWK